MTTSLFIFFLTNVNSNEWQKTSKLENYLFSLIVGVCFFLVYCEAVFLRLTYKYILFGFDFLCTQLLFQN